MKNFFKNFITILIFFLSACKVSKDLKTPKPALPNAFRNEQSTDTTSIGNIGWKQFFADANLQTLIDSAITNNFDMQYALQNIIAARLALRQTKYGNVPAADFQITAGITRPSNNSLNGISLQDFLHQSYIEDYSANITLSWEADIWGKIREQKAAALANYLETAEARKALQTSIIADVANGYYNLLMLDDQLNIARKNLSLNDSTLQIIKLEYDAGQVTALAIQQTDAQRLTAAQLIPQFEQQITIQENALSILTGVLPDSIQRNATMDSVSIPPSLSAGIPAQLLNRRPDIKSYEFEIYAQNALVGIAKANLYPSLNITAQAGVNSFKASNWFTIPASLFGAALGSVMQPLIEHKRLSTNYAIAKVNREKAVIDFRRSVLNAVGEVSDALISSEKLKEQQDIATSKVEVLRKATNNANLLFKNGLATYLEVITAESNFLQAQLESSSLRKQQLSSGITLYKALGGGWQ